MIYSGEIELNVPKASMPGWSGLRRDLHFWFEKEQDMNRRTTVPILLACAFALLAPPPAFADYVGLEVVDRKGNPSICQDPSEPEIPYKLEVCDIYAGFDDSADRLISVAFTNVSTTAPRGSSSIR